MTREQFIQLLSLATGSGKMTPGVAGQHLAAFDKDPTYYQNPEILSQWLAEYDPQNTLGLGAGGGGAGGVGGGTTGTTGWATEIPALWESYYLQKAGVPGMGRSPYQDWVASQMGQLYGTFMGEQAMAQGATPTAPESDWERYVAQYSPAGHYAGLTGRASDIMRTLASSQTPENLAAISGLTDEQRQGLVGGALRSRYNPLWARQLAGNIGNLETEFLGQTQGQGGNFLDYLRRKFNLW